MIIYLIAGFLAGSIPTAFLAGKMNHIDIRQHGSGNVGATNAFRVLGKKIGLTVFAIDLLKGFLPAFILPRVFALPTDAALWIGLAAILGHVFSPWLGFRGGKGIATGSGVLLALQPALFIVTVVSWILVFKISRIVSLSSLVAVGVLFVLSLAMPKLPQADKISFAIIALFVVWTHRANIGRLLKGEEKRL